MTKIKLISINLFILLNFMMMIRAQLDMKSPVLKFLFTPATIVQDYFSMWRGWAMFAPNPLRTNAFVDAKIIYKDGSEKIWNFPRASEDNLYGRYVWGERYRKYIVDGVRLKENSFLWEDTARYVLRNQKDKSMDNLPTKVILRRRWNLIQNWNKEFIPHRTRAKSYNTFEFYTYKVLN